MAFPTTPRVIPVELYVSGSWVDISSDVYVRGGITISRGRKDEQSRAEPSSCSLVIDNRSGNYSPRNPVGVWYGSLGRNTPLRVSVGMAVDTFSRTVSNGWGTSDTGQLYTFSGSGGTVTSANVNVAAGVGTIALTSTNISRTMTMAGLMLRDVDVSATVTMPFSTVTGASIYPAIIKLRDQGGTNYIYARTVVLTTGVVQLELRQGAGSLISSNAAVAGLTYSGQALSLRFQAEGQTFRAKVWDTALGEPYGWSVTANTPLFPDAGLVGVTSWVSSGNTNTLPIVVSYDDIAVRVPRFTGEVAAWPQRWDLSGQDVYVPIQAAGIKRRLGQGAPAAVSVLRRYFTTLATPPVAYWPMEDARNFGLFTSALGGSPLIQISGPVKAVNYASYTGIPASAPLPTYATNPIVSTWQAALDRSVVSSELQVSFMLNMTSSSEPADGSIILQLSSTGNNVTTDSTRTHLLYHTGGSFQLLSFRSSIGTAVLDTGTVFFDCLDKNLLVQVQLTQVGAGVSGTIQTITVGEPVGIQFTTSVPTLTVGSPVDFVVFYGIAGSMAGISIGHLAVRRENITVNVAASAINGYAGETAVARMQRICVAEGLAFSYKGTATESALVGPQHVMTALDALYDAADVDFGTLYEAKGDIDLSYRTRSSVYSQIATLDLDYTAGQVAPPLEPVDDDLTTRNDITVSRVDGLEVEAELTTGRMSTLDPASGGVGRYVTKYTLNVYSDDTLPDVATWLLTLGTIDGARYPTITVDLATTAKVVGLEANALAVDIDDCITISNPKTGTTPDQIRQIVRGYTETLNVFTHRITFNCAPESPYRVGKFDATPLFRYDTTTSTLAAGVSSSATSISVANVNEPWTTDPTQWPIPIAIAGEELSVTAVSGTSTPQTFTVVRSVNGVVKAQLAGTVVQIYPLNSATYAL